LTPAKGAVNNSTLVFFEADSAVPEADVAPQMKDEFIRKILQVMGRYAITLNLLPSAVASFCFLLSCSLQATVMCLSYFEH